MTAIQPICCGSCKHFLPDVTDEKEIDPATGWCQAGIPGEWVGWKKHKWQDSTGKVMVHAEGACSEHEEIPAKTPPASAAD